LAPARPVLYPPDMSRDSLFIVVLFGMAIAAARMVQPADAPAAVQTIEQMTPDRMVLVTADSHREIWIRTPDGWRRN
jgi:hypothetical protein